MPLNDKFKIIFAVATDGAANRILYLHASSQYSLTLYMHCCTIYFPASNQSNAIKYGFNISIISYVM